jgi:hypothetical protein
MRLRQRGWTRRKNHIYIDVINCNFVIECVSVIAVVGYITSK